MEVGIFTFWTSNDNYGQTLQSFALQYYLNQQKGINAEVIRYYASKPSIIIRFKSWIKRLLLNVCPFIDKCAYDINKKISKRNFGHFKRHNINYSSRIIYGKNKLNKYSDKYDILITGSDQVWSMMLDNPKNGVYFLDFGNKKHKRISYAASFGTSIYPTELKYELRKHLARIDSISVREKDGITICKECGRTAVLVLDPTLLLNKSIYQKFLLHNKRTAYTYLYVLNINSSNEINWDEIKRELKTEIIVGTNGSGYTSTQVFLEGVVYEDSTIEQWLSNIAYAETIITSSFHGIVFSIIFEKDFIFIPLKGEYAQSNNRVMSILLQLGLEDRVLTTDTSLRYLLNRNVNYSKITPKLEGLRFESIKFLKDNLQLK